MHYSEEAIRPTELYKVYLELCAKDAETFFADAQRVSIACPACGWKEQETEFTKWGFDFVTCCACRSLYQSPRPDQIAFSSYYQTSSSAHYWAKEFLPQVEQARRELLYAPKVRQILDLCARDGYSPNSVVDVGAGSGLFLEEWRKSRPKSELKAVEPNSPQAEVCRLKGFEVVEGFAEEAYKSIHGIDLAISLEVLEHVYDPLHFCHSVRKLLKKNGRALFTTLSSSGFDIQILWENSRSVAPPQHLNFMTLEGMKCLMTRAGFSRVDIFTPGKLDVDIVANAMTRNEIPIHLRFVETMLSRGETARQAFQHFLINHKMSSHCWIWAYNENL
jgi:SAM-dependent methyltransferase